MPRIRDDFEGGIWAHGLDEHGHVRTEPVWLAAGDEVPAGVEVSAGHLEPEATDGGEKSPPGGGEGDGDGSKGEPAVAPFDPDEFTVDEVNEQLEQLADDQARAVIEVERAKRARHGVLNGPAARRLAH